MHPIEFGLTQSTKQVVDRLVVGIEHVPQSWSKEVHRMNISCVHRDIPKDLTLAAEERNHPLTPHLVVLPIEVWRTQTPFVVRHLWLLDWLESIKTQTGFDTN
jgi:phage terminase large subunit GpA-like protein